MEANLQREKLINYSEQQWWCLHYCLDTVYPNKSWTKIEEKKVTKGENFGKLCRFPFNLTKVFNVACVAHNVELDFFCDFQTLWLCITIILTESRLRWKTTFVKSNKCVTNIDEIMQIMRRTQIDCKQSSLLSKCFSAFFFLRKSNRKKLKRDF